MRRRASESKARTGYVVLGAVAIAGTLFLTLFREGRHALAGGTGSDVVAGALDFASDWEDGDADALANYFLPDKRALMSARFERLAESRGWRSGYAPLTTPPGQTEVRGESRADTLLVLRDGSGVVRVRWRFELTMERWFATELRLSPLPLDPRVSEFARLWDRSDPSALAPVFRPGKESRMAALLERELGERGWSGQHPALGAPAVTDTEGVDLDVARLMGQKFESVFPLTQGELLVRWSWVEDEDEWYAVGFRFPDAD